LKGQQKLFDVETESKKMSDKIKSLICELAEIELQRPWSEEQSLLECAPKIFAGSARKQIGLYKIIHNKEVKYVGMGNVSIRKSVHCQIFRNKGKAYISDIKGTSTDSPCARKMYNHDKNLENWRISYLVMDNSIDRCVADAVMKEAEKMLVEKLKPPFCLEYMVGK
tara:strand:- start:45 stop:545 length:501 start_codon:yes stop_codon:yes gene_type:complete